jgi:hypothetical protein
MMCAPASAYARANAPTAPRRTLGGIQAVLARAAARLVVIGLGRLLAVPLDLRAVGGRPLGLGV